MKKKTVRSITLGIILAALTVSLSAQESVGDTVGTVTFAAVSTPAWRVTDIEGDGVFVQGGSNALVLEVGGRYVFDLSSVDSESFPMELRDGSGTVLASQRGDVEIEDLEGADISVTEDEIQFTLTESLGSRLSFYRAATYPSMLGVIRTYSPEAEEAAAEQTEDSAGEDAESAESD